MSSIAYITDHKMIEYHRLHGNTSIIFWRPASQKKFASFYYGDYLFFLTKGTEKGKEREKGVIGYGRFAKEDIRSVHDVWKKYKTKTGYGNEQLFQEAVRKVNKTHELPDKMHCLYLENIIFFQAPVYLSEVDKKISKQIESYIYLDQDISDTSWRILQKAKVIGTDMWATLVEQRNYAIDQDADLMLIQTLYESIHTNTYTVYEKQRIAQFVKQYKKTANGTFLANSCDDFFLLEDEHIHIYLPCLTTMKTWKRHLMIAISRAVMYQNKLQEKQSLSRISILLDEFTEEAISICKLANVDVMINQTK